MKTYKSIHRLLILIFFILMGCSSENNKEEEKSSGSAKADCDIPEKVSYKNDILPILKNNCYKCHNDDDYASKAGGNKMEGYENIKKLVDKGLVYGNVAHKQGYINMPYKEEQLPECKIQTIKAWIDAGAPKN